MRPERHKPIGELQLQVRWRGGAAKRREIPVDVQRAMSAPLQGSKRDGDMLRRGAVLPLQRGPVRSQAAHEPMSGVLHQLSNFPLRHDVQSEQRRLSAHHSNAALSSQIDDGAYDSRRPQR